MGAGFIVPVCSSCQVLCMSFDKHSLSSIAHQIWDLKYRLKADDGSVIDVRPEDSWKRVADAAASAEKEDQQKYWQKTFYDVLSDYLFLPGGRILAGAGTERNVTLFNCYVMGNIDDDMVSIFDHVKEAALTLQQGGGIGQDFSTLRPKGDYVRGVGADASGPVSFMNIWDSMCRTMMSAGTRRGAMMATMRCDHPDIEEFITVKKDPEKLRMFNLSVLVTDAFMEAVKEDLAWDLVFNGKVYKTVQARDLWDLIMQTNYDAAEPGVIFIDRINALNLLNYCEEIYSTNPCGEQPLPPYGACLLGSVNLAKLITKPFSDQAELDEDKLVEVVRTAIRFLDNIIDISRFPLPEQGEEAFAKRRIGLGVTGLADALIMCQETYGSKSAQKLAKHWMKLISHTALQASCALAREKGAFPKYDEDAYLSSEAAQKLPQKLRKKIRKHGLRNGLLTSIAPTGTISLYADNVSSGIEPVFDLSYERRILDDQGTAHSQVVQDYAYKRFYELHDQSTPLREYFVTAQNIRPEAHLAMQAAVQPYVDSAISKTINCPADISFEDFKDIYLQAYEKGLKGCTTYRPNAITGAVLVASQSEGRVQGDTSLPVTIEHELPNQNDSGVVYMSSPLERDEVLSGHTYKLKWPGSDHALYVTINDVIQDGRRRPFEIFINSKNLEHYSWTVALTRMISAVFRRGGDISFVAEELKAIFDPRGGQWLKRRYVPSLQAAIGEIIEKHMQNINFLPQKSISDESGDANQSEETITSEVHTGEYCPRCSSHSLVYQEGCKTCYNCGKSECS